MLSPRTERAISEALQCIAHDLEQTALPGEGAEVVAKALRRSYVRELGKSYIADLRALCRLRTEVERRINIEGTTAIRAGMTYAEVAAAAGMSRQRAHQRFRARQKLWRDGDTLMSR
jgi:hypothetical protein